MSYSISSTFSVLLQELCFLRSGSEAGGEHTEVKTSNREPDKERRIEYLKRLLPLLERRPFKI